MLQALQQSDASGSSAGAAVAVAIVLIGSLFFIAIYVVSLWKIFAKMGQAGWSGIVPILNYVIIARLSGKEWWYGLLPLVPCIGFVFAIVLWSDLSTLFGHGGGFTVGLVLLPIVFLPILAFGDSVYQGPPEKIV